MTHDPLCPYADRVEDEALRDVPCGICDLIAKVREDMLCRCEEAAYTDLLSLEDDMREAFGKGGDAARIVAGYRSAMPSFQQFYKEPMSDLDISRLQQQSYRQGQADMLAKCIAAVDNAWVSSTDYPCNEFPCKVCGAFELSLTFLRELMEKP